MSISEKSSPYYFFMTIHEAALEIAKGMRRRNRKGRFIKKTEEDTLSLARQKRDQLLSLVKFGVLIPRHQFGGYMQQGLKFSESSIVTLSDAKNALDFCGPVKEIEPSGKYKEEILSFREKFEKRFKLSEMEVKT